MVTEWLGNAWTALYFFLVRPMWKWVLRKYTGRCELLRICYQYDEGAKRTKSIERSLKLSRVTYLKELYKSGNIPDTAAAAQEVMKIKAIVQEVHPRFMDCFQVCLCQICGYKKLKNDVDTIRRVSYSAENSDHEKILLELWDNMMPGVKLETRICNQWKELGFQGEDPKTDFRGMGVLGLYQLLHFATKHREQCRRVLSRSNHPTYWYPYAVVGINLTKAIFDMLQSGALRTHFYNTSKDKPCIHDYHEVYCYMFFEFDKFWFDSKPKDIMEFGRLQGKFKKLIQDRLKDDPSTVLVADFQKEE
ncbi:ELMO domain-containing protein 2-like [Mizuhopecten yessoensis]|uniref:ELMO domain-containing protein 1 n=1 Tax=Mizuhopecten yessoensis TaxID=6573 RepID=A0A210PLG3_MIZYE|nr:ELMO domain-containing protein 2-like [Mizuhopecten yessoensis]XP_021339043.1 ELMO domain-containing protein 2-like [Mizuhopecten yessoensis]XP_021339044.1 ELMO domain-containing protein 2-like [Mizuhopecten yessoensis]XP_021339045.1 ELMO domain-containing protein 2-like [Mizuhopecten yessoensis]XP_021339046.1 ELMO domain-containing protein 2-like [Mizuhopecten yessoensis]OWF37266.1 ELMO domain-containing protein 1 [Mizuhopecten yessoensis]